MTTHLEGSEDIPKKGDEGFNLSAPTDEFHGQETENFRLSQTDEFFEELGQMRDRINRVVHGDADNNDLPWGTVLPEEDDDIPVGIPLDEDSKNVPVYSDQYRIAHVRLSGALDPQEAVKMALEALGQSEFIKSSPSPKQIKRLNLADTIPLNVRRDGSSDGKVLE